MSNDQSYVARWNAFVSEMNRRIPDSCPPLHSGPRNVRSLSTTEALTRGRVSGHTLTDSQIEEIRSKAPEVKWGELAKKYSVSSLAIGKILTATSS